MFSVITASLALGIRHGIDWDHIAAITDITSTSAAPVESRELVAAGSHDTRSSFAEQDRWASAVAAPQDRPEEPTPSRGNFITEQRRALWLGTLYALGHGSVVFALGLLAILASEFLPSWIDPLMGRIVGITLIILALYLFYSLYQYFRGGGAFQIRSRWMLVFATTGKLVRRVRGRGHDHAHPHLDPTQQYGQRTAFGIGMIHGIGAETGTQALIIAGAAGATSKGLAVLSLIVFIVGLLISNSFVTIATATGFVSARNRQIIYVAVGAVAAVFSLLLGLVFLFGNDTILPDLDPYFRWIGGPSGEK